MYSTHPYFSLTNLDQKYAHYTQQNMVRNMHLQATKSQSQSLCKGNMVRGILESSEEGIFQVLSVFSLRWKYKIGLTSLSPF